MYGVPKKHDLRRSSIGCQAKDFRKFVKQIVKALALILWNMHGVITSHVCNNSNKGRGGDNPQVSKGGAAKHSNHRIVEEKTTTEPSQNLTTPFPQRYQLYFQW